MTVKFNDGNPTYICDGECRVLLGPVRDVRMAIAYKTYCTTCAYKKIKELGEVIFAE